MATKEEIVKLAIDSHRNCGIAAKYSKSDSQDSLREALIEANGGSAKLDINNLYTTEGREMFSIVSEIIRNEVHDYWTNNEITSLFVEYHNVALGDGQEFWVEDDEMLAVSTIAEGSTNIRRQRLEGGHSILVPMQVRGIKVYDDLVRVMSGRTDLNHLIDLAVASCAKDAYERQLSAWSAIGTDVLGDTFCKTGTADEDTLMELIYDVELETNENAVIYGTKKALRKIAPSLDLASDSIKDEFYRMGYLGTFYSTPCIALRQSKKLDGTRLLDDNTIFVVASSDKPVKYVTSGDGIILQRDALSNADLTYEWAYIDRVGVGIAVNKKFGKYVMA